MKKLFFTFVSVLSLLATITSTVFAAPLKDGIVTLAEVRNDQYGGVKFIFNVSGEFGNNELRTGVVFFGDEKYGLHCKLEDSLLTCTTSQKTAGHNVTVNIGGFVFWVFVPGKAPATPATPSQHCYGVYDVYYDEDTQEHFWEQFDTYCQDSPANYGDLLEDFENPDFGFPSDYEFLPSSPVCFDPITDDAYYGICPS